MTLFKGAATAIVTPFAADKTIDFTAFENLLKWQIAEGIDAIVVCGTTGEASTLSDEEHIETVEFAVKVVGGRVPVIAGAGSNDTAHALEMSNALAAVGADGLLMVTPYYNKCSQEGLYRHYIHLADNIKLPMILYSVPGRTGVNITPATVERLHDHPKIVGIKEASGDISQVVEIAKLVTPNFAMYSGNDDMVVPLLSVGGTGVISTVGNIIPKDMHRMVKAYLKGEAGKAADLQLAMKSLVDAMFAEVNPIPIKAALNIMGKIDREYRLPLCDPSNKTLCQIAVAMKEYGLA